MSSYPHIYLASAPQRVKTLVDVAIDACIQHKHLLGKAFLTVHYFN
jgi:hypothetical protein